MQRVRADLARRGADSYFAPQSDNVDTEGYGALAVLPRFFEDCEQLTSAPPFPYPFQMICSETPKRYQRLDAPDHSARGHARNG